KLMKAPEEQIDLFHAALLVSQLDNPDLDVASYRQQLETITAEVKAGLPANSSNDQRLKHLIDYLFQQNGFHGSRSDYYHRANSYIDRVLDDREGLPITISVLFLELAQRGGRKLVSSAHA